MCQFSELHPFKRSYKRGNSYNSTKDNPQEANIYKIIPETKENSREKNKNSNHIIWKQIQKFHWPLLMSNRQNSYSDMRMSELVTPHLLYEKYTANYSLYYFRTIFLGRICEVKMSTLSQNKFECSFSFLIFFLPHSGVIYKLTRLFHVAKET